MLISVTKLVMEDRAWQKGWCRFGEPGRGGKVLLAWIIGNAVIVMVDRVKVCAWCLSHSSSGSLELE